MDPKFVRSNQANCLLQDIPSAPQAAEAFESLKKMIEDAVVTVETIPFEVETDGSKVALAAFFSRTLQGSELKHASIEK